VLDDETLAVLGHLNRIEFSRSTARWSGRTGRVVEEDGVLLCAAASDFPVVFNSVHRLDPGVPPEEVIGRADAFFGAAGRGYTINVRVGHPADEDLRIAALRADLVELTGAPEMVCTEAVETRPPADGVTLRWVEREGAVEDFVAVADAAYVSLGVPVGCIRGAITASGALTGPDVCTVVADLEGEPVATALCLLSHGIAGVYYVGTLEQARGRGLADLVTRAVTNRAFDEGARASTLQASAMGEQIYARMGYRELYRYAGLVRLVTA
jgi:hypothetical protein